MGIADQTTGLGVSIERMSRRYRKGNREIPVLDQVDLELAAGDRVAIVGPSGSGKSTFLHAVGLLDQRTTYEGGWFRSKERVLPGRILMDGKDVSPDAMSETERAAIRNRRIGFVFQAHYLLPQHTALGNVMIPVRLAGASEEIARNRAMRLLAAVGLAERIDHRPGELSGGEQQRVAIARALVMAPGLVLADEPTGNLDPRTAVSVLDLLLRLNEQLGSTLVVVTHSTELARRFPRRLALEAWNFRAW